MTIFPTFFLGRFFDFHILDMIELGIDKFVSQAEFPVCWWRNYNCYSKNKHILKDFIGCITPVSSVFDLHFIYKNLSPQILQ